MAVLDVLDIGVFFPLLFLAAYWLPGRIAGVLGVAPVFTLRGGRADCRNLGE